MYLYVVLALIILMFAWLLFLCYVFVYLHFLYIRWETIQSLCYLYLYNIPNQNITFVFVYQDDFCEQTLIKTDILKMGNVNGWFLSYKKHDIIERQRPLHILGCIDLDIFNVLQNVTPFIQFIWMSTDIIGHLSLDCLDV